VVGGLQIVATDEREFGASHEFEIRRPDGSVVQRLSYQKGGRKFGINGVNDLEVIAVSLSRALDMNAAFPSQHNQDMVDGLTKALEAGNARTLARQAQRIEGDHTQPATPNT
jgi:hypothetical protein